MAGQARSGFCMRYDVADVRFDNIAVEALANRVQPARHAIPEGCNRGAPCRTTVNRAISSPVFPDLQSPQVCNEPLARIPTNAPGTQRERRSEHERRSRIARVSATIVVTQGGHAPQCASNSRKSV